jgi:hypothetical protein
MGCRRLNYIRNFMFEKVNLGLTEPRESQSIARDDSMLKDE